jgi:phosphoglycolate phosphatase
MAYLILWDIDHTLIENNGVSKAIYAAAFTALTARPPEHLAPTDGRTDPAIMRELFDLHHLEVPPWPQTAHALEAAGAAHFQQLAEVGQVLPGVTETVTRLARHPGVIQTVLTGNIGPNAVVKLAALGIDHLFDLDVGAYGSDDEIRSALIGIARARATIKYSVDLGPTTTMVIGDTPRDVEAALAGGALAVAVASGLYDRDELTRAGADLVLDDLVGADTVLGERVRPPVGDEAGVRPLGCSAGPQLE